MTDAAYKRWGKTTWLHEGYEALWAPPDADADVEPESDRPSTSERTEKENVVYLTADSEEELTELKKDETYIIGGLCDHNRYKVRPLVPIPEKKM
jgi:tRNA (guanine9-N1)-methyltransferase